MSFFFFFNDTATTEIYTLSLHDALPISWSGRSPSQAPSPLAPQYARSRGTSCTTPTLSTPPTNAPIDTAYCGYPWRKLVVPSSGSTIHTTSPSRATVGDSSSPTTRDSGTAC